MAKRFLYVCAGIFLLVGAYALGAGSAGAQGGARTVIGFSVDGPSIWVMTDDHHVHLRETNGALYVSQPKDFGSFWDQPTPAAQDSWGSVKSRYQK